MDAAWDFKQFKAAFKQLSGLDLDCYKDRQMERRIRQLIEREGYGDLPTFLARLREDREVLHKFLDFIPINTSHFFRDEKVYDYLRHTVLLELLQRHERINIWSMGCSRGEEPYSVAIILNELGALDRARLLASDIDDKALAMARKGFYTWHQVEKVPLPLLKKYFEARDGGYYICNRIKEAVSFQKHNFLTPIYREMPPMDLVLCRNVFIYLKPGVQAWIVEQIAKLITPGGYLVTGCAEIINNLQPFGLERMSVAVYRKSEARSRKSEAEPGVLRP
jgi:chemotaxis protein methyltransferase CheR